MLAAQILVVGGSEAEREQLGELLAGLATVIRKSGDGEPALQAVKVSLPDLVLLQVDLPGIDAFETCRQLKANPATAGVPVIFLGAFSESADIAGAFSCGAADIVPLPFEPIVLRARVQAHLTIRRLRAELEHAPAATLPAAADAQRTGLPGTMPGLPHGARVLVVDDNTTARASLRDMCAGMGIPADAAADGWEALRHVDAASRSSHPYDLVLADWQMPGMDGVELVRHLTRLKNGPLPSILVITAFGRAEVMQQLIDERLSVSAVLTKPVTPSTLLDSFAQALGRPILGEGRQTPRTVSLDEHRQSLRGARILLVEDHAFNRALALELLQGAGVEVTVAANGQRALDLLAERDFDGVLMDCQMPVMDGCTATRLLRERPELAELPVIAMTAHAGAGEREKLLACGMNDHIAKPLDVEQMFAVIARWVAPRLGPDARAGARTAMPFGEESILTLPGIDAKSALAWAGGNTSLYARWLDLFRSSYIDFAHQVRAARSAPDARALGRLAHAVKGAAGTIGAANVVMAAGQLEDACVGSITAQALDDLCGVLVSEVERVVEGLPSRGEPSSP